MVKNRLNAGILPGLASGILFGLSYPSVPWLSLEPLAWISLVPWLLSARASDSFREYLAGAAGFGIGASLIITWSLTYIHLAGGIFAILVGATVMALHLVCWYPINKIWGWEKSLPTLPFLWVSVDWLFLAQPLSLPWWDYGQSQARMGWVIQQADIFGLWGITFWLVAINSTLAWSIDGADFRAKTRRFSLLFLPLFIAPFLYSKYVFSTHDSNHRNKTTITVTAVQANIPWADTVSETAATMRINRHITMTTEALAKNQSDLVIWPENAIGEFLLIDLPLRNRLFDLVLRWNTNLITSLIDHEGLPPEEESPMYEYLHRRYRLYNATTLITPELAAFALAGYKENILPVKTYRKRHLFPLHEFVPYAEVFPFLVLFHTGSREEYLGYYEKGREATTFRFRIPGGRKVTAGTIICIEQIFTDSTLELVRNGAEMLLFPSDDSISGGAPVAYQLAQFARIRAVETRRPVVRAANTGLTFFVNRFGNVYSELERETMAVKRSKVILENEMTFYVRHSALLPIICMSVTGLVIAGTAVRHRRANRT